MSLDRRRFLRAALGAAGGASLAQVLSRAAAADPFPSQAVRVIVATTPGTVMDISARLLGKHLEPIWRQPIVILNQAGAGGAIGTDAVAKARPDGHTLLVAHEGILVIQPLIQKATAPRADVRSVAPMTEIDLLLVVNRASGLKTLADLLTEAQRRPGKLTYASAGNGTPVHLRMEMFKLRTGVDLVHVPYKSTAAGLTDLVGGHVDCMLIGVGPASPHLGDKLNVLGIGAAKRLAMLPDVPTLAETFPGLVFTTWFAMFAPADTPREVVDQLSRDISAAMQAPEVKTPLLEQGINPTGGTPEQLDEIVRNDFASYSRLLTSGKLQLS